MPVFFADVKTLIATFGMGDQFVKGEMSRELIVFYAGTRGREILQSLAILGISNA